jgi:hypothetical protein
MIIATDKQLHAAGPAIPPGKRGPAAPFTSSFGSIPGVPMTENNEDTMKRLTSNTPMSSEWREVADAEMGHVFYDAFDDGIRVMVLRGPAALCAYLGIPKAHPLAGFGYEDIPLRVHGGLTYSGSDIKGAPSDFYWFGWDYAHSGDWCVYDDKYKTTYKDDSHKWTVKEVVAEAKDAVWDFSKIVLLAERIALKDSGLLIARKQ